MRSPLIPLLVIAALLLTCRSSAQVGAPAVPIDAKHGGAYRLNLVLSPRGFDPARIIDYPSSLLANQIYDLLVDYDSTMALRPRLAKRWEVSADGLTYTYHLRTGIRFQDDECFRAGRGRMLTAHDVKYCFDRMLDNRAGAVGASYFTDKVRGAKEYYDATAAEHEGRRPAASGVAGFRAVDDSTFTIELLKPYAPFKHYPTLSFCYIYPQEAVTHYGNRFFMNPVGTGAFRLKEWRHDTSATLVRNPNYWRFDAEGRKLPYLDSLVITFEQDEMKVADRFERGALHEIYRPSIKAINRLLPPMPEDEPPDFVFTTIAPLSTQFYGMHTTRLPFSDRRVRQAFNYAVDRTKLVKYVLTNTATPAVHGITPPGMPGYPIDSIRGYDWNPEKGRALLAEAGYPGGKGFPSIELLINEGGGRNEEMAEAVVQMIEQALGIRVKIRRVQFAQLLESIETGRAVFYRTGWIADRGDPEDHLALLYSGSIGGSEYTYLNTMRYVNYTFDSLYTRALATHDDAERNRLYREAEQSAIDEAPILPLIYDLNYLFLRRSVRGLRTNATGAFDYAEVWLAK